MVVVDGAILDVYGAVVVVDGAVVIDGVGSVVSIPAETVEVETAVNSKIKHIDMKHNCFLPSTDISENTFFII